MAKVMLPNDIIQTGNSKKKYAVTRVAKYLVTEYERFTVNASSPEEAIEHVKYGVSGSLEYSEEDSRDLSDISDYNVKEI